MLPTVENPAATADAPCCPKAIAIDAPFTTSWMNRLAKVSLNRVINRDLTAANRCTWFSTSSTGRPKSSCLSSSSHSTVGRLMHSSMARRVSNHAIVEVTGSYGASVCAMIRSCSAILSCSSSEVRSVRSVGVRWFIPSLSAFANRIRNILRHRRFSLGRLSAGSLRLQVGALIVSGGVAARPLAPRPLPRSRDATSRRPGSVYRSFVMGSGPSSNGHIPSRRVTNKHRACRYP